MFEQHSAHRDRGRMEQAIYRIIAPTSVEINLNHVNMANITNLPEIVWSIIPSYLPPGELRVLLSASGRNKWQT